MWQLCNKIKTYYYIFQALIFYGKNFLLKFSLSIKKYDDLVL